jgi:hypothetical protein
LMAGDDHIPIKSGSNKKPFQRDNIHAEHMVLKGCARPAGKDMMIARLAPTKPTKAAAALDEDGCELDSDDETAAGIETLATATVMAGTAATGTGTGAGTGAARAAASGFGKMLNARPCARCEARMVARGVRRCYFTLNNSRLGVLEYNADDGSD